MKKQYVRSERAHFMCPNMHFGMMMELAEDFDEKKLKESLERLAKAHPFLECVMAFEEGSSQLFYKHTGESQIQLVVGKFKTIEEEYSSVSWDLFNEGLLKVKAAPSKQGTTVLFMAHHLLTDGRGLLELAQEFAADYVGGIFPKYVEENLIASVEDLPKGSKLSGISKFLVKQANRQWAKEATRVDYPKYHDFERAYTKNKKVSYETYELNETKLNEVQTLCKENGVTINDYLMAKMYLETGTNKIILAFDIRNQLANYQKGALGNYATAMGIVSHSKTDDVMAKAKEVHKLVQKQRKQNRSLMLVLACYFEMAPTLLDAAAISALGGFESKAGTFVGRDMFGFGLCKSHSITNLGKVENEYMESLFFIPPASPAAKLTLGVVTLNGTMRACSSTN